MCAVLILTSSLAFADASSDTQALVDKLNPGNFLKQAIKIAVKNPDSASRLIGAVDYSNLNKEMKEGILKTFTPAEITAMKKACVSDGCPGISEKQPRITKILSEAITNELMRVGKSNPDAFDTKNSPY